MQSSDVLDFAVVHLSTVEALQMRHSKTLFGAVSNKWRNVHFNDMAERLHNTTVRDKTIEGSYSNWTRRTVALLPLLGGDEAGPGHLERGNDLTYFKACFWSVRRYFPHVVAGVASHKDAQRLRSAGLPLMDVIVLDALPSPAALSVALLQTAAVKLDRGDWKKELDFVYFTEGDQVLMWRMQKLAFDYLRRHPLHILVPHRLSAYPKALTRLYGRTSLASTYDLNTWATYSCCIPRQNCENRVGWTSVRSDNVHALDLLGLDVPLGNSNFKDEMYRPCVLRNATVAVCP